MRSTQRHLISLLLTLLFLAPAASFAQKRANTSVGTTSRRDSVITREAEVQSREARLRRLSEGGAKNRPPQLSTNRQKLIVSQIYEDFERIQIVNRDMMQASAILNPIACKQIAKFAEEMNKRARRLKSNLGVPDLDEPKKISEKTPAMDEVHFRVSLQTLNASVRNFVGNPLFQDPRVTDVRELDNLRQDISTVIELSRTIRKTAEKLH